MMKRWLAWRALVAIAFAIAQTAGAEGTNQTSAPERHSLWKVEDGTNVVYLLGSIHLLKPDDYPLPLAIERAFTKAQVVAFEVDLGKMQGMDAIMKLATKSLLPDGETLQDQLTPATYTALTNHLIADRIPAVTVQSLRPFIAAAMLEVAEYKKLGFDENSGVDEHFYHKALDSGKTVFGLETVDFQIDLMTDFTKEEGEQMIKSQLEEIDDTAKDLNEMVTAWKTGDAPALAKLFNDTMRESPGIYKRLLTDRSASWIPKIEEMLKSGKTSMVIVGAGHLVGDDGVVELLRKKGWKIAQL